MSLIGPKEAAQIAGIYFRDLYQGERFTNVLLEEIEIDDASDDWLVTLGFDMDERRDAPGVLEKPVRRRHYKIFRIDGETGSVRSMKIRIIDT